MGQSISAPGTYLSKPLDMKTMLYGGFQWFWTGTLVGTVQIMGSLGAVSGAQDQSIKYSNTGTATNPVTTGGGSNLLNIGFPAGFRFLAVQFTYTSGAGLWLVNGQSKGTS